MGRAACTEPQCLYKVALYLYLWSWKSRAIPLLSLWAVRLVQSLSACTRVHFTFTFGHEKVEPYLYSPYGPYGLYRASVPVQGCTLPFLTSTYLHIWIKKKINDKWQSKRLRSILAEVLNTVPFNRLSSRWPDVLNYAMDMSLSVNAAPWHALYSLSSAPWHALYHCLYNEFYRRTKFYLSCLDVLVQFQVSTQKSLNY